MSEQSKRSGKAWRVIPLVLALAWAVGGLLECVRGLTGPKDVEVVAQMKADSQTGPAHGDRRLKEAFAALDQARPAADRFLTLIRENRLEEAHAMLTPGARNQLTPAGLAERVGRELALAGALEYQHGIGESIGGATTCHFTYRPAGATGPEVRVSFVPTNTGGWAVTDFRVGPRP